MRTQNKRLAVLFCIISGILSVPLIAMLFTNEVKWNLFDFVVMGALLSCTGLAIEIVIRKVQKPVYRMALCVMVVLICLLTWAEMAVGLFGSPIAGS